MFDREVLEDIAYGIIDYYEKHGFAIKYTICGGLRRKVRNVYGISIVLMLEPTAEKSYFDFRYETNNMSGIKNIDIKQKTTRFTITNDLIPVSIYTASKEDEYETMKLVRTGNNLFIIDFAREAKQKGTALMYSNGQYGVYGAVYEKNPENWKEEVKTINPLRKWNTEKSMIEFIYGKWIPPEDRSFGEGP